MLLSLLSMAAFTLPTAVSSDSAASNDDFMRIFHLDCGRKYFSVNQIKELIDAASASNYTHVELAIGNDALRFLLGDMSVTVNGTTYTSEQVSSAIHTGNEAYYNFDVDELTETEMNTIIAYAKGKNISIIPLLNSPGHMDAIIDCMESLGMSNVAYNNSNRNSNRTISLTNTDAAAFTKALIEKYVKYFASKGCKYFNMGADEYANDVSNGFAELISNKTYGNFVTYVNDVAGIIETAGMTPIAFNDGIYYNSNTNFGTFDKKIVISYWTSGWDGYTPASAYFLAKEMNHKIINTNDAWYYVLGRAAGNTSGYTIATAKTGVKSVDVTTVPGGTFSNPSGCMLAFWCDSPSAQYNDTEVNNVKGLISTLAANNKDYFTSVSPAEPEILTSTGSTTLDVNGGSTTLSISDGAEATWTVDPSDGSVIKLISASNADGDSITGSRVEAVATGKGTATITATVGTKNYTMKLTVADPNEVTVEVPAGSNWTTTVKDVDLRNQVGDYDESVAKVKVSYDKKDGGITVTPVTSVSSGTAYYIRSNDGKYLDKDAKWVADSASAAQWTCTGTSYSGYYYLKNGSSYLYYSNSSFTTSSWNASYFTFNNGSFSAYNYYNNNVPLGSPVTIKPSDPVNASTITITGVTAGQETTVKIGDVTYRIKVTDKAPSNAMTADTIKLEYWITNYPVYTGYTGTNGNKPSGNAYYTVSSTEASSDDGIAIANETIAPDHAYSFFDGRKDVYYWQAMRLDKDNYQTDASGDDETSDGTTLTHVRYHNNAWQYKTTDGVWHYFVSTDQLVAYYLQKTKVTKEIDTYAKDWGYGTSDTTQDTSLNKGQVALTVAVVYPDGTVSPAESDMYANSTTIFNYWDNRDIGIIAPKNNSDYNISKITVTNGMRKENTSANVWYTDDSITWKKKTNVAGKEWYDETEVWNKSSGTTPMVNGTDKNIDSTVRMWPAKNYAKLVLIYLEPVEKVTNLNVQYIDLNANNHVFHSYQVAMKYNQGDYVPTFTKALMLGNTVIGDKGPWMSNKPDNANYLSDDAYVTNSSGTKQTFKKDITTIPEINGIYASGLYKYMKADISEDGKTLRLYYDLNATAGKTFVVDFGLPVEIPFSDFGITNVSGVTVSFNEQNTAMTERQGNYGNGKIDMDAKTVTYTLTKTLDAKIPIPVYVADKSGNVRMLSVNVMPATSVYYEDSFAKFSPGTNNASSATWSTVTDGTAKKATTTQALSALGRKDVYGYDAAYKDSTKLSMGSAQKVTVTKDMYKKGDTATTWPSATFTFKGTGFDVISLTSNTSGSVVYTVTGKKTGYTETHLVDTYYGYKLDGDQWVVDKTSTSTLYQIPVIKVTGLAYDEYTVTLSVRYGEFFDHQGKGNYSFWLDAIRVYDPMGVNNATYVDDGEGYPQYIMLRNALVAENVESALFIDGAAKAKIADYKVYGPNNEVYLENGQAITFTVPADGNIESIQIGAKAPDGSNPAKMVVNQNEAGAKVIQSATEMYYEISKVGTNFTITNMGDGILSLTNLKITFKGEPDSTITLTPLSTDEQNTAVMSVRALFAAPEQTFEPEYFTAKWSRNVRKGGTATLTVKASADVEAITVNGEEITTYTTKTARSVWGAKETYHVFTYRVPNAATADYSICAVNGEGAVSDPITAKLTVRPSIRDWWNDIFDKWKH